MRLHVEQLNRAVVCSRMRLTNVLFSDCNTAVSYVVVYTAVQKVFACSPNLSKNSDGRVKKCSY